MKSGFFWLFSGTGNWLKKYHHLDHGPRMADEDLEADPTELHYQLDTNDDKGQQFHAAVHSHWQLGTIKNKLSNFV